MSDDRAPALKRFVNDLNETWTTAGPPSFAELEAMSMKFIWPREASKLQVLVLAHATTQGILAGRRRSLPKWSWVASFITVLRAIAAKNGVAPDSLGTLAEWKAKHAAATDELRRAKSAEHGLDESEPAVVSGVPAPSARTERPRAYNESERAGRASVLILAKRTMTLGWWQDYRDVVPDYFEIYLSLEPAATLIRGYETEFFSDLLQTEEYAAAAIRAATAAADAAAPALEINRCVELRMVRQQILTGPNPTKLWMILDESVLRRQVGNRMVMRAQLDHLIEICHRGNVTVQALSCKGGAASGGGAIAVLRFAEQELPDVTYLEQPSHGLYPSGPGDRVHFAQVLDRLAIEAQTPAATIDFLYRIRTDI
jgi:hypothetical protein